MGLITTSDVEAYLGVTFDSAETAVYTDIIEAVSDFIECYTGQNFTDDVYTEKVSIIDNCFNLNNNVQHVYGAFYGVKEVIEVTGANAQSSINVDEVAEQVKLTTNLTTDATISISTATITSLNTTLGGTWTSTIKDDVNSGYPALTLYHGTYRANPDDSNKINLLAANEPLDIAKVAGKVYSTSIECAEAVVIYQGGYTTIPDDLKDATIRFVIKAYNDRNATVSGDLKRERVGDYEYEVQTASDQQNLSSLAIDYYGVLDCYKTNLDI